MEVPNDGEPREIDESPPPPPELFYALKTRGYWLLPDSSTNHRTEYPRPSLNRDRKKIGARIWSWSELPVTLGVSRVLFDKLRRSLQLATLFFLATIITVVPGPVSAQEIIRCPDWKLLVSPAVLRSSSERVTGDSFDAKLQMATPVKAQGPSKSTTATNGAGDKRRAQAADCTHAIQRGDTLGKIAARYLGTSNRWPEIARTNPGIDSKQLRIGAVIKLPCAVPAGQGSAARRSGGPLAGTAFLGALSGQKKTPAASGAGEEAGATATTAQSESTDKNAPTATKPVEPVPTPTQPLPVWTAKSGEDFASVLKRWSKVAGYRIVIRTTDAWTISVPIRLQTDFESAVAELVRGLGSDGRSPPVRVYKNKVIRLGGL